MTRGVVFSLLVGFCQFDINNAGNQPSCCVRAGGADRSRLVAALPGCALHQGVGLEQGPCLLLRPPHPDGLSREVSPWEPPFWWVALPAEAQCWGPEGRGAGGRRAWAGWDRGWVWGPGRAGGAAWPESSEVRWRWRRPWGPRGRPRGLLAGSRVRWRAWGCRLSHVPDGVPRGAGPRGQGSRPLPSEEGLRLGVQGQVTVVT